MPKSYFTLPALLLALTLAAPAVRAGERPILHLYTWSEFFAPEVLAAFEDEYDCVVAIDTFDSNEAMLADVQANPGAYDIVTPSSYMVAIMRREGLLAPLRHELIPNLIGLDADFVRLGEDPDMAVSVPYTRTVTGVGYNARILGRLAAEARSWSIFARRDLSGRLTMLDDIRESMGAALKFLGYSLNTTDPEELRQAGEQLRAWRGNLAKFEVDEANIGLGSGDYLAVHGYNGDMAVLMEENADIDFFVPREGSAMSRDDFVVLASSRQGELAHALVNHMLEPANAAANMEGILYYMPVPAAVAMLDEEILDNRAFSVPDAILAKCEMIRDLGEANAEYEEIWEQVTGGAE